VELEPLLWQAPPLDGAALVLARDLGPEANAALLRTLEGMEAFVLLGDPSSGGSRLLPYVEGMALLWGGAEGAAAERPPVTGGG